MEPLISVILMCRLLRIIGIVETGGFIGIILVPLGRMAPTNVLPCQV